MSYVLSAQIQSDQDFIQSTNAVVLFRVHIFVCWGIFWICYKGMFCAKINIAKTVLNLGFSDKCFTVW